MKNTIHKVCLLPALDLQLSWLLGFVKVAVHRAWHLLSAPYVIGALHT